MRRKQLERALRGRHTRFHHSLKNQGRSFWCESNLEADFLLTAEFDDMIEAFVSQPLSIGWHDGQATRRYTPDVLVWRADGRREFLEIKPLELVTPEVRWKVTVLNRRFIERFDTPLKLVTESDFIKGSSLENLHLLYSYRRFDLSPFSEALQALRSTPEITLRELREEAGHAGLPAALPFAAIAHGHFRFNTAEPLSAETRLEAA